MRAKIVNLGLAGEVFLSARHRRFGPITKDGYIRGYGSEC